MCVGVCGMPLGYTYVLNKLKIIAASPLYHAVYYMLMLQFIAKNNNTAYC